MDEITMQSVVSSNISAIGFREVDGTLRVSFTSGGVYETVGATKADHDAFITSKSKGVHFNKVLKTSKSLSWRKVEKKG